MKSRLIGIIPGNKKRCPIGERVSCCGPKLGNSLLKHNLAFSMSTRSCSGRAYTLRPLITACQPAPADNSFAVCSSIELRGITKHLTTDPTGDSLSRLWANYHVLIIESLTFIFLIASSALNCILIDPFLSVSWELCLASVFLV